MKKKILIALLALMLPAFVIINSVANNSNEIDDNINVEVNNDIMINSPLFTKKENNATYTQPAVDMTMDGFDLVATKGDLSLYSNKKNGSIRIQNNVTKFVWASDILNIGDYKLSAAKKRQLQSGFIVSCYNAKNSPVTLYAADSEVDMNVKKNSNGITNNVDITLKNEGVKEHIKFEYSVTLTETGINVHVPYEKITETGDSFFAGITLFPYLGSVYGSTVPGYVFVPSGNGGLVRYDSNPAINAKYSRPYYGTDANRTKVSDNKEEVALTLPIYGIAHGVNQNAILTTINSGSSFATFNYEPASINKIENTVTGVTNGFHNVYNTFNYRETYQLNLSDTPIFMKPEKVYAENVDVTYTLLNGDDANYIGMAKAYQKQLKSQGVLKANSNSGSANVHFDILGGETENGIVLDKFLKMTTTEQLKDINAELTKKFSNKFIYTLRGYYKDGYSRQTGSNIKFDSRLGSMKDLEGLDYYMYYNPVESYGSKSSPDNKSLVNIYNEKYYLTMEKDTKYKFYANSTQVSNGLENAINKYGASLAIDGIYHLYGDNNNNVERYEMVQKYNELVSDSVPMFKPNAYMFGDTSHYLNMPLYHDRSRFITDSVPFLQILLRGYIDYYSTYLNFSTNQEIDLLKCIEYGSNLAYLISAEESYLIANTLSSHLYATHYGSNKEQIFNQINAATLALNHVKSETIENRVVIENGVVEVTYSNGVRIYVNYTSSEFTYGNVEIPSMGYKVVS